MFDFQDSYDDAEAIPAEFRNLYNETEEGLAFDKERFSGVRDAYTGLNKALKNAREGEKGKLSKVLEPLHDFGETPESIREAFEAKLAEARKSAETSGNEDFTRRLEKARNELVDQHTAVLNKQSEAAKQLRLQLEDTLGRQQALSALSGKALDPDLALPFILQQLRPVEGDDGRIHMVVVDSEGDPRLNPVTQQPVGIKDLVDEMSSSEKYAPLFRSEAPTGGGVSPAPRPTANRPQDRSKMSSVEKIKAGLSKGQARDARGRGKVN